MNDKRLTAGLTADWRLDSVPDLKLDAGATLDGLVGGPGSQEVLAVRFVTAPTVSQLRKLHKERLGGRNIPLVLAACGSRVTLLGPSSDAEPLGPLTADQARRLIIAFLSEPSPVAARLRIRNLAQSVTATDGMVGIDNSGLFATHYLQESVRHRRDWDQAVAVSNALLDRRGVELITALGYESEGLGSGALLLKSGDSPPHGVAVLIQQSESFDAMSSRFDASPVAYGLKWAAQQRVPWLLIVRGSELRLYPAKPEVGVGRRSQSETYFGMDLSVVDGGTAGFLHLVFAGGALADFGSVSEILDGSARYAASLGERLRDRVYTKVVPFLAVAVADELERLGYGDDLESAYRITLKILFRLLFQAYGEDQGLLPYKRNDRYTRNSLTAQAQDLVREPDAAFDAESHSIWDDLQQVWAVIDTGDRAWDVPAYNGGLFGANAEVHPDGYTIARMKLSNAAVGAALRHLLVDETVDGVGAVDFRSLSVREFGTIYEGLLESSLSRAEQDLTVDKNGAYVPAEGTADVVARAGEVYFHNASGERKSTGSYFTRAFAVEHLLERTLDPALDRHLETVAQLLSTGNDTAAYERFFDFRVADLSMGSGHFLVAAVDRIEAKMTAFLVDYPIPRVRDELNRLQAAARDALGDAVDDHSIDPASLLRRQIARRCIYGLDINGIAVELARVGVWIHTFVPGLPMSSLDHNLVCANSLTGFATLQEASDAVVSGQAQQPLIVSMLEPVLEEARGLLENASRSLQATKAEVTAAAEISREAARHAARVKDVLDALVAYRMGLLGQVDLLEVDELLERAETSAVAGTLRELNPGHIPFLFPEISLGDNPGFDVLVGNPPWKEVTVEESAFWSLKIPGLRARRSQERAAQITELRNSRPDILRELTDRQQSLEMQRTALLAGPYEGMGSGDPDVYKAFAWRFIQLCRRGGSIGVVLPRSIFTAKGSSDWRRAALLKSRTDITTLRNKDFWVFDINPGYTICLVALRDFDSAVQPLLSLRGRFNSEAEYRIGLSQAPVEIDPVGLQQRSEACTVPDLGTATEADLFARMIGQPQVGDENSWAALRPAIEFHVTKDSKAGFLGAGDYPVYNHLNVGHLAFEPEAGAFSTCDYEAAVAELHRRFRDGSRRERSAYSLLRPHHPESWFADARNTPVVNARIVFRGIVHANNPRKVWLALVPPATVLTNAAPYLVFDPRVSETQQAFLLAMLNSGPCDWYGALFISLNMNYFIFNTLPLPEWRADDPRCARASSLAVGIATEGWEEPPSEWSFGAKFHDREEAVAEIDAIASLLYRIPDEALETIWNEQTPHRPSIDLVREMRSRWK